MKSVRLFLAFVAMLAIMTLQVKAQDVDAALLVKNYAKANKEQKATLAKEIEKLAINVGKSNNYKEKEQLGTLFIDFIDNGGDTQSSLFLINLFKYFETNHDIDRLLKYVDNAKYADATIRTLAELPAYANHIMKLAIDNDGNLNPKDAYAYAIGKQKIVELEYLLHAWLKGADNYLKLEIYTAFMRMGSDETQLIAEKGAKKLYKKKDPKLKIGAMRILVAKEGEAAMPYLYKALKNKDMNVRREALTLMIPYTTPEVSALVVKKYAKKDAIADIVWWIGEMYDKSQADYVVAQLSSQDPKVVKEAIIAVFKLENDEGLKKIKPMIGGVYQPAIKEAVLTCTMDPSSFLADAARGNDQQKLAVIDILKERQLISLNNQVFAMLNSSNPEVRDGAYKVLKNVVIMSHAQMLMNTMETCDEKYVPDVLEAIKVAMSKAKPDKKDEMISMMKHIQPDVMVRFYKVFAYLGTENSINKLVEQYHSGYDKEQAVEAILLINDRHFAKVIKEIADEDEAHRVQLMQLYNQLTERKDE